jgi:zinc and cadmium transporter
MVNSVFELAYIFLATFIVSLFSFVGVVSLALKDKILNKILLVLIGLSAGALMGGALLHLLPEAIEKNDGLDIYLLVLVGFILFFLIEKVRCAYFPLHESCWGLHP